ncbi:MAG: carbohydrate binding family 9 domain-containing protein, partial [bacterium]
MNHFISFLLSIGVILILWNSVPADINVLLDFENYEESYAPNLNMSLQPVLISQPIVIDGVIDSSWFDAASFKNFTEYQPTENRRARVITAGYLAYDADNLYVSFICQDPEISQLRASLTDRDNIFSDDWVCISIDPDNDQQKAYEFYVNARGIQGDRLWQANGTEDEGFDLVWQSDAKIYENYWTAEVRIPFESLRFPNREDQSWLVHFTRQYPRDNQYRFSWMPISADNNSFMGQAGKVDFSLPKVRSDKRTLEVLPYILGNQEGFRVQRPSDGEIGEWKYDETDTRAGFGLKYSISSNLIADFTYNPDFSQIESDAGQISVNFPFALFYDERRPFFQEGADMYVVDQNSTAGMAIDQYVNLFYSRSINDPKFAGKISGRNNRLSFGVTSAYDRYTPFVIPFEERSAVLATDKKSYSNIVRMRYDLGNQSSLGLIVTD